MPMRRLFSPVILGFTFTATVTGCGDFLTGPKLQDDPNNPTAASNNALFVASQVNISTQLESRLARLIAMVFTVAAVSDALQYGFELLRKATGESESGEQGAQGSPAARAGAQA